MVGYALSGTMRAMALVLVSLQTFKPWSSGTNRNVTTARRIFPHTPRNRFDVSAILSGLGLRGYQIALDGYFLFGGFLRACFWRGFVFVEPIPATRIALLRT